jgi:hypothetical protein
MLGTNLLLLPEIYHAAARDARAVGRKPRRLDAEGVATHGVKPSLFWEKLVAREREAGTAR